jgi:large subunit ribosomal protein L29
MELLSIKDLKSLSVEELKAKILDSKKELMNVRFQKATSGFKNTSRVLLLKKYIARMLTIISLRDKETVNV